MKAAVLYEPHRPLEVEEIDDGAHTPSSVRSAKQSTRGDAGPTTINF